MTVNETVYNTSVKRAARCCFISLIFLLVTACQRPSEGLIGEWSVDQKALINDAEILKVAPPAGILLQEWRKNMTKEWSFRFHADRRIEVLMHGTYYEGRYQITREVGHTVFLEAELKAKNASELDGLLGIPTSEDDIEVKHFSVSILGKEGTLSLDEMLPLKILHQPLKG